MSTSPDDRRTQSSEQDVAVSVRVAGADDSPEALAEVFAELIPQLSSSSPPPTADDLRAIITNPHSALLLAERDGAIVGSLTLATYRIPTGLKGWIEDVVVDESARGMGVGEALNLAALDEARRRGVKDVSLTSRPTREAANRLYQRIGFEPRTTNVYRYQL